MPKSVPMPYVAERDKTVRAAVTFAAAAGSWDRSPELRERLMTAINNPKAAIMLTHAENDFGTRRGMRWWQNLSACTNPTCCKSILLPLEDGRGMSYENNPHGNRVYLNFLIGHVKDE